MRLLTESESEEDHDLLADIFNLPDGALPDKKTGPDPNVIEPKKKVGPKKGKRIFNISRLDGGFAVSAAGTVEITDIPQCLEIQAAYEVRRGNAFSRYIPEDFDLKGGEFNIELHDATLLSRAGNRILAKLESRDFKIAVKGFDVKRDVRVRVTAEEDCNADPVA